MNWRSKKAKNLIQEILSIADVQINGHREWDIQINNPQFYARILDNAELALGESYMDGWWDCFKIDAFVEKLMRADVTSRLKTNKKMLLRLLIHKLFNLQNKKRAFMVGETHYDIGNDLYERMLDSRLNYSCGYWKTATTLEQAQLDKLELSCKKLKLQPGMRLLDIGCGWGAMAKYAAKHHGVEVVGVTVSKEQKKLAEERCKDVPVKILLQDYRDIKGKFDRVVSIGMFEHVGHKNYNVFMETANRCLHDNGLLLLHTIGNNITSYTSNAFSHKYIFPNGMLPSSAQIAKSIEGLFFIEDWHNFGADYDKTLMAWHHNFNQHWHELKNHYNERFYRMWNFYLLSCAGDFRARDIQLWQIVMSKHGHGVIGGYQSVR